MLLNNTWRFYLFSGFLFFLALSVKGNKIDSLIRVYEQSANDTIRCLNARMVGHAYRKEGNRDSTFQWFETAEKIAIRSGLMIQLLRTYEWWVQIAGDGFNDRQLVIDSLRKELLMAKNRKDISVQIRISQIIATMLQNQMASYDKAYKEWLDVEKLVQQQPDLLAAKAISIPLYGNLAWLLKIQGNPGGSIPFYRKSIALSDQFGLKENSLQIMADLAESLFQTGQRDEAVTLLRDKLKEIPKEKDPQLNGRYNEILTGIYSKENKFDTALTYALNSLYKDAGFAVFAFRNMQVANCYYKLGNYDSALHYGLTALEIAETNKLNKERFDSHNVLKEIYRAKGNYKEALYHYTRYAELQNEQFSFQTAMNISGINAEREKEREELQKALADAELARQKRIKTTFLIGALAAMLVLLYIIVQHKKLQKEKNRSEELLLNILPYETSEELKATGMVEARKYSGASILFTDFVGFTEISSQVSPEELLRLLNECFSAFDRIIEKHQLEKIKTIGDAYMAAGGLPKPKASHAFDIVSAALDIRDFIEQMIAAKISAGKQFFKIRIGVNSGPIVAGIVGIKKFQYDIWGDTVNIASRMESSGEIGKVNISAYTYELLKDKQEFSFISRGKIKVKGKGEMEMYIVERNA